MAKSAELALVLSLVDEVSKGAQGIKGELEEVGKTSWTLQGTLDGLAGVGKTVLGVGLAAGGAAATALATGLGICVRAAADAEEGTAQLEAVLKSTKGAAGLTKKEVLALASGLQDVTRFGDDAILSGQNILLTFTGIGKDVFPQATETMLDMAQALKIGPTAAATMLGKALNDPVAGLSALSRVGVVFTDEQKELVKQLQASGDIMGAQKVILQELQTEYGGSARAAGETFAGKLDILKNKAGDVQETIGNALLPGLTKLAEVLIEVFNRPEVQAGITAIVDALAGFAENLGVAIGQLASGDLQGALSTLFGPEAAGQIIQVKDTIVELATKVGEFVSIHAEELKTAILAIGAVLAGAMIVSAVMSIAGAIAALANPVGLIIAAVALLAATWAGNWGDIQGKTQAVIDWIAPYIQQALAAIQGWWSEHGGQVLATVAAIWQWIQNAFNSGVAFVQGLIQTALAIIQSVWENHGTTIMAVVNNLWSTIQSIFNIAVSIVQGIVNLFLDAIHGDWYKFGEDLRKLVDTIWENLKTIFRNAVSNIILIVSDLVRTIISKFREIDWAQVGQDIISGIANGIRNAAGWLADAARGAAQAALDAAKGFLGIHSPSAVAAKMIGRPFVEGIGQGIDEAVSGLDSNLQSLAASMVAAPVPAAAGVGGGGSITFVYSPTFSLASKEEAYEAIAPVLREVLRREGRR